MATFTAIKNKAQGGGAMGRALDYVEQEKKTLWEERQLVTGWNCVARSAYLGTASEGTSLIATRGNVNMSGLPGKILPYALGILGVGTVATLSVLLFRSRRALRQLQDEPEDELEHEEEST